MSEAFLGEIRSAGTADLVQLYVTAKNLDLNRKLPDSTAANLDPNGIHVLTTVLLDHRANPARGLPLHHRVYGVVKMRDSARPFFVFMDVTAEHWEKLYSREESQRLMVPGQPLKLSPRLFEKVSA